MAKKYLDSAGLQYAFGKLKNMPHVKETTWSALKALRDNGQLVAGLWYRITDYECTTSQENTRSAGHQFDILVQAIDEGHLSEEAKACRHSVVYGSMVWNDNAVWSDGDDYFANSKLEAWKIWYCLDNDTERFAWAVGDSSGGGSGEGEETYFYKTDVDDYDDEVDYQEKCILDGTVEIDGDTYYKWHKENDQRDDVYYLTETNDFTGASLNNPIDGIIGIAYIDGGDVTGTYMANNGNQIVEFHGNSAAAGGKGVIYRMIDEWGNDCPYDFKNMLFKRYRIDECVKSPDLEGLFGIENISDYSVDTDTAYWCYTFCMIDVNSNNTPHDLSVEQDVFMNDEGYYNHSYNNVMKAYHEADYDGDPVVQKMYLPNNVFVTDTDICAIEEGYGEFYGFYANTLGSYCYNNTFGNDCGGNTFGNGCDYNTFGNSCDYNTFGNDCGGNTFGNGCYRNTFGNNCGYNTFGNGCDYNTFGNGCYDNTFGNGCGGNTFGNGCYRNTFGNSCGYNTFGNNCGYNTFGNNCGGNTFGNSCDYNTFGNNCGGNTFGNSCDYNTFGNNCDYNTFGNNCGGNTFGNYVRQLTVFEGVTYCSVTGGSSNNSYVQNAQILNGTSGTNNSNLLTITFVANVNYTQIAGKNSSGVLKIWTPADLV